MPPKAKLSKNAVVSVRIGDELRRRLDAIHDRHKSTDTTVVTDLLQALVAAVEREDAVRAPFTILFAEKLAMVAEPSAPYPVNKPGQKGGSGPPIGPRRRGAGPDAAVSQLA